MSPRSVLASVAGRAPARRRSTPVLGTLAAALVAVALVAVALVAAPAAAQEEAGRASAALTERNDSGVAGTVELTAGEAGTRVVIQVEGATGGHPTHIHDGSCADPDPNPKYPLTTVDLTGLSETTIAVPLAELLGGDHLVLIHSSAAEIGNYLACGDILPVQATPSTGVGAARPAADGPGLALAAAVLGALLAAGAAGARARRPGRPA
jgi:hypothetical protein